MRSKFSILILPILAVFFMDCAVKQVRQSPNYETSLHNFKRLTISVSPDSKVNPTEAILAKAIAEQELAHHKEFIVYPDPSNKNVDCGAKIGKSQGVLKLKLEESLHGSTPGFLVWLLPAVLGPSSTGMRLSISASIQKCDTKETLWEGRASSSYPLEGDEDATLRTSYENKLGKSIGPKVLPYYDLLKSLLDQVESPVLTESEQDEKIEVEAGG
ncbi:hypothetical protein EHQ53_00110 [Leptospira langatensis]|uniref:Lipoprotein n=1 Tax=Leptospira langatensis TaxID=2484983 RepID=A0A5F1ZXW5_9LEPT|nr:MXAN_6521/LA_1396 family lipoprotein [Leptospira langatensis]TGJ98176.1 hypothetical protein EHO57_16255 [Leptospira langatensis]TGL43090.1 hypothetical protein EHQ53_00110 [Leptospira langatensis]